VCLEIKHPSGAYDQIFITVSQLRLVDVGLLSLASAVILRSESRETSNHILLSQLETSLSVASYNSQGYGGGIRHGFDFFF
jgi:hypothetical protein